MRNSPGHVTPSVASGVGNNVLGEDVGAGGGVSEQLLRPIRVKRLISLHCAGVNNNER